MNSYREEKPSLEDLLHYGVKGMKWGVRTKKSTSEQIQGARQRQSAKLRRLLAEDDIFTDPTASKAKRAAAEKRARKLAADYETSEDRVVASRATKGEKFAHVVLLGPLSLISLPANKFIEKQIEKDVDRKRKLL